MPGFFYCSNLIFLLRILQKLLYCFYKLFINSLINLTLHIFHLELRLCFAQVIDLLFIRRKNRNPILTIEGCDIFMRIGRGIIDPDILRDS